MPETIEVTVTPNVARWLTRLAVEWTEREQPEDPWTREDVAMVLLSQGAADATREAAA